MSWNPRTGGFAGLTAAGLLVLSAALQRFAPVDVYRTVAVVALATVVAAVAGVHTAHRGRPRYGPVGAVAAAVAAAGYAIVAVVIAVAVLRGSDSLFAARVTGAVLLVVGSAVLGIVVMVARRLPRWCGVVLVVGFPVADVADSIVAGGENLVLALLWGSIGLALLALEAHPAGSSGRAPAGMPTGAGRASAG